MDNISGGDAPMHMSDEVHLQYMQEHEHHQGLHQMSNGNGVADDHDDGSGADTGGAELSEVHVQSEPVNLSDTRSGMVDHSSNNGDQLTLSFQGQVFVFDSVSPEKVQAVLLLLGGHEVPPGMPAVPVTTQHDNRALTSIPQRLSVPQRLASLIRFREKRKERNFDKKIRYTVRKEVALRMQRKKGQFTSSKPNSDDSASAITSWGSNENLDQDANGSIPQEAVCLHCGTNEKCTPMMRRGPDGPRTLCNACGLMWANKGTLRDLSKAAPQAVQNPSTSRNEDAKPDL
ncbi:GATA transcription factor 28 isoform X2 [Pyrus x bretschneideri]|uniref:GATA transcription factor 28 isoform X2 n=1 Tax=Pyrus x bretschneideri TaxID=225117 RepID=UPI000510CB28|nr:GATA transcription factor 28 isoform X2 [Pyrus x bretschneideri]